MPLYFSSRMTLDGTTSTRVDCELKRSANCRLLRVPSFFTAELIEVSRVVITILGDCSRLRKRICSSTIIRASTVGYNLVIVPVSFR